MSECGSNLRIDVQGAKRETFDKAFELVELMFAQATEYIVDPVKGLVFLWGSGIALPVPFSGKLMADIAWKWLEEERIHSHKLSMSADLGKQLDKNLSPYGENLDHDGSNTPGWRIYNEEWGHVGEHIYAIVAVQPAFIWRGK